jgi:hypothetical protein
MTDGHAYSDRGWSGASRAHAAAAITQAGNDRAARVIHTDFVAFFRGMSSSANEFQAFSTGGVRQSIW